MPTITEIKGYNVDLLLSQLHPFQKAKYIAALKIKLKQNAEKSFYVFFQQAWSIIWPTIPYSDSWYYKYLCNTLQQLVEDNITKKKRQNHLNVNILPGSGKTSIISIALPVWVWIKDPTRRFITTSYSPKLAEDNNEKSNILMQSKWFKETWGDKFVLIKTLGTETKNDKSGYRITTSPGSKIGTGYHADFIIHDDPQNAEEVYSKVYRANVQRWIDQTMASRLVDKTISVMITIQQRLHCDDISAHLRKNQGSLYKFVVLPGEDSAKVEPRELKKFYQDGLLDPVRFDRSVLDIMQIQFRNAYSGQVRQDPVAEGGNLFKEEWAKWFANKEQLPVFSRIIVSADTANEDKSTSCPVSIQVWGESRPNFYLLYDETKQMSPMSTTSRISAIATLYPGSIILVENAASGFGVIEALKLKHYGVFAFPPQQYGGKEKRAESILYLWEAGNVYLPDSQHVRTIYLPEILAFPVGEYKDRVDAMSQALIWFTRGSHTGLKSLERTPAGVY
jgi:predicted phage terminase large subunit-like protein